MQEPLQQVNNTVISFIACNLNELPNIYSTVVTSRQTKETIITIVSRKSAHSQKSSHLLAQFLVYSVECCVLSGLDFSSVAFVTCASKASSHCKTTDMGTLSWLNAKTPKRAPTLPL